MDNELETIILTNGTNTLTISPNNDSIFEILKGDTKVIWTDADGNANFSGRISGGEINIDDNFVVTENGEMSCTDAYLENAFITGRIDGADINDSSINGGEINIADAFIVSENGEMSCTNACMENALVTGEISGADINGGKISGAEIISTSDDSEIKLIDANILVQGYNGCLRHSQDGTSYSRVIGVSSYGNLVIGHDDNEDFASGYGGKRFSSINFYGDKFNFKQNSNGGTPNVLINGKGISLEGHTHDTNKLTPSLTTATYGNNISFGSISAASTSWVQSYGDARWGSSASDLRLKKDIQPIEDVSELYLSLKPKSFQFKDNTVGQNNKTSYGLIAQHLMADLESYGIPWESTSLIEEYECFDDRDEGKYTDGTAYKINYENLHAWHINMIQQLTKRIEQLESQINCQA